MRAHLELRCRICLLCLVIAPDVVIATQTLSRQETRRKLMRLDIAPAGSLQTGFQEAKPPKGDKPPKGGKAPTGGEVAAAQKATAEKAAAERAAPILSPPPPSDKVNMKFGGNLPTERTVGGNHWLDRPEFMKSLVCGDTTCSQCKEKYFGCWHGITRNSDSGSLDLQVKVPVSPDDIANTRFVVELYAKCSGGQGYWTFDSGDRPLENGDLAIYANGELVGSINQSNPSAHKVKISIAEDAHVRIEFTRSKHSLAAKAKLWVYASNVDRYVDNCMGKTDCLEKLGDESVASFTLRNDNSKQYKCLTAATDAARSEVSSKCPIFAECVAHEEGKQNQKHKLKSFLTAAMTRQPITKARIAHQARIAVPNKGACNWGLQKVGVVASCLVCNRYFDDRATLGDNSRGQCQYVPALGLCFPASWAASKGYTTATQCLEDDRSASYGQDVSKSISNDESECIDPTMEDPEAWECDCLENWIASCGGVDADCFHTKMCERKEVCSSWKQSHNCPTQSALQESTTPNETPAALMSRRAEMNDTSVADSLFDSSLSGKCSQ